MVADLGPDLGRPLLQELAGNKAQKGPFASMAPWHAWMYAYIGAWWCLVRGLAGIVRPYLG